MNDVSRARWTMAWVATGVAALAALLVIRSWTPWGMSTCLLYNLAGTCCPGCGMTRATILVARGDIRDSLRFHPLAVPFAIQALVAWGWWGLVLLRRVRPPSPWWGVVTLATDGVALVVTWIVRLATGTLPG